MTKQTKRILAIVAFQALVIAIGMLLFWLFGNNFERGNWLGFSALASIGASILAWIPGWTWVAEVDPRRRP